MNRAISPAQMKWSERAEARPPMRSSGQCITALKPGERLRPVRISMGVSRNTTPISAKARVNSLFGRTASASGPNDRPTTR